MPSEKIVCDFQTVRAEFLPFSASRLRGWWPGLVFVMLGLCAADAQSQMLQQFYQGIQPPGQQPCVQAPGGPPCPPSMPTASDYSRGGASMPSGAGMGS